MEDDAASAGWTPPDEEDGDSFEPGPFTAFGQFGPDSLDLRVFDQSTWWVNRDGLAFRITTEMSTEYLANVIAFLEEHRRYYHRMTMRRAALTLLEDVAFDRPVKLPAALVAAIATDDSTAWLEGTALMQVLRATLAAR